MDEMDIAISRSLLRNSRITYSEMGKELGLSPQAVHRRVQTLMDADIIRGTSASLSFKALGQMWAVVYGWSRAPSMDEVAEKLKKYSMVGLFQVASGNFVYIHGAVKDADELATFVSSVQKEARIQEVQVGIVPNSRDSKEVIISDLDLRLIAALKDDSRKPIAQLANEVGTSAKTARKRLDRLIDEDLVHFSIHWQPDTLGDTLTQIHLGIRDDVEREKVAFLLIKRLSQGAVRTYNFSNLPNQIIVTYWTKNVRDMQLLCRELEGEGVFISVVPNILRGIYYYEENREAALEEFKKRAKRDGK